MNTSRCVNCHKSVLCEMAGMIIRMLRKPFMIILLLAVSIMQTPVVQADGIALKEGLNEVRYRILDAFCGDSIPPALKTYEFSF